ncbi:hypothetical protein A2U01_0100536, partial [Trifolium medium]|nr:hypothetical protein [Trifolium medium]
MQTSGSGGRAGNNGGRAGNNVNNYQQSSFPNQQQGLIP